MHADAGGALRWRVDLGDEVSAGQTIAELVDLFGAEVETLTAPTDGFVLRKMLYGSISTGAEVAWIAS